MSSVIKKSFLFIFNDYNRNNMYFLHSIFKNGGTNMHWSSWQFHFNIPKCSFGKKNPQLRFLNPSRTRSLPRTCNHHFLQLYNLISISNQELEAIHYLHTLQARIASGGLKVYLRPFAYHGVWISPPNNSCLKYREFIFT